MNEEQENRIESELESNLEKGFTTNDGLISFTEKTALMFATAALSTQFIGQQSFHWFTNSGDQILVSIDEAKIYIAEIMNFELTVRGNYIAAKKNA